MFAARQPIGARRVEPRDSNHAFLSKVKSNSVYLYVINGYVMAIFF